MKLTTSLSSAALSAARLAATLCAAVCLSSCFHAADDVAEETLPTKAFTFNVKGDFATSYEDFTKGCATNASHEGAATAATFPSASPEGATKAVSRLADGNAAGLTDLWVLDYAATGDGGSPVLLQSVHQSSADAGFGSVSMRLTYGHHDVKFIASRGTSPTLAAYVGSTGGSLAWQKVHDTFVLDYPVDVVASSNGNRVPELKRAVSGLKVVMTDEIPQDAKTIVLTLGKRSQSLTLPTLSALPYTESSVAPDCSAYRGTTGNAVTIYTLAGDEDWTSTASICVKREDGSVITAFDLPEVTLRKNRITTLTGEVFNRTSGFQVSVDAEWDAPLEEEF